MGTDESSQLGRMLGRSAITLTQTDRIPPDVIDAVLQELRVCADVAEPQYLIMCNTQPPEFVQLLGNVLAWAPFAVAATEILRRLASRATDSAWDSLSKKLGKSPIERAATSLAAVVTRVPNAYLAIGLNSPDVHFGTVVCIESKDAAEIAIQMARFVANAAIIEAAMKREEDIGYRPVGRAFVSFEGGRIKIAYCNRSDNAVREVFIEPQAL